MTWHLSTTGLTFGLLRIDEPLQLADFLIEVELFRCVGDAFWDEGPSVLSVVRSLDRAVVEVRDAHVGPINMTGIRIYDNAVGEMAISGDDLAIRAIGVHRVNSVAAELEEEQSAGASDAR